MLPGFRKDPVALVVGIKEMFVQVPLPSRQRGALKFLRWESDQSDDNTPGYQMTSHPSCATPPPIYANFAPRQAAIHRGHWYGEYVPETMRHNFCADGYLVYLSIVHDTKMIVGKVNALLENAEFSLRDWVSSRKKVLEVLSKCKLAHCTLEIDSFKSVTGRNLFPMGGQRV